MTAARDHTLPPGREPPSPFGVGQGWPGPDGDPRVRAHLARLALLHSLCRGWRPSLLEVACGAGDDLLALSRVVGFAVGVDAAAARIQQARLAALELRLDNLRFTVGDAVAFYIDGAVPATYDLIVLRGCMAGLERAGRLLDAARRRLAPGGRILVLETNAHHPAVMWRRFCLLGRQALPHPRGMTPGLLRQLAARRGLEPVAYHLLPWAPPEEEESQLTARGRWSQAMARLPLPVEGACFGLVLRPQG